VSKHQFSQNERYTTYMADGAKCFWCGIPLLYSDVQIDHVFPESLLDDKDALEKIKTDYGLGSDFNINSFENWVTCHQGCNLRKRNSLLPNAPQTLFTVAQLRKRAPALLSESKKFVSKRRAQEVLTLLESALTAGALRHEDVFGLMADSIRVPIASADPNVRIRLSREWEVLVPNSPAASIEAQGWKIHHVTGNIAHVHDGRVGGVIPNVADPHPSWLCSQCGSYGPWDGVICRNCGNREEPDC
jgi:5-methylcytosine-specific restriction endonuclease McrA